MDAVTKGLCSTCANQRVIQNTRGSRFTLCERARTDARLPKYPRLPVLDCHAYEPAPAGPTSSNGGQ